MPTQKGIMKTLLALFLLEIAAMIYVVMYGYPF